LSSLGSRALARGEFLPIVTRYAAESDRWRAPGTA